MALMSVIIKKHSISAALIFGYIILVLPFHFKSNIFICPFMIPTVIASKILSANNYIIKDYANAFTIDYSSLTIFLLAFFIIPLTASIFYYRNADVK
jgi:hypothetical protein